MDGIFSEDELKAADQAPEAQQQQQEPEQKGPERDPETGKFVAKQPEGGEQQQAPEGEEGKDKGGTVPQGALHAERERRKAVENELKTLREQLGAIQQMREQVASRKPEDLPPADDPAAVEHLRNRLAQVEQTTTRIGQERDAEALNQREIQQLGSFMHQSEAAFRQQQPDYDDAINHVVNARAQELALYGLNPTQIAQTISEEATEIVRAAVAQGRDPAELGYQIARSRGYVPKQAQQQEEPAKTNGSGGAQAMLDAIANAQKQSKSLGSGGGSAPAKITAEAVAAMSADEFERLYSTEEGKRLIDSL